MRQEPPREDSHPRAGLTNVDPPGGCGFSGCMFVAIALFTLLLVAMLLLAVFRPRPQPALPGPTSLSGSWYGGCRCPGAGAGAFSVTPRIARNSLGERTMTAADQEDWIQTIRDFSDRNTGRRVRVEVDDPEAGAQPEVREMPLRGVDYDPHGRQVEIMLGEDGNPEAHVTHTVNGVTAVDTSSGQGGGETLRVASGDAQTLVRMV